MEEMRTGDCRPIPLLLRAEVNRLRCHLVITLEMIREVDAEREQALQTQDDTASRTIQALRRIRVSVRILPPF
jgi:transposase